MGKSKVADVPVDADASQYQAEQQAEISAGLDSIPMGKEAGEEGCSTEEVQD